MGKIERKEALEKALKCLTRAQTSDSCHKVCICVICDCFIIRIEPIHWLSEGKLKAKEGYLSVAYLESVVHKTMPLELRNKYKIRDRDMLSNLMLSPRAHMKNIE